MDSRATRPLHFLVRGRVQGVGFRYHVVRAAERAGVSGVVRNLTDGRVEGVAAGSAPAIAEFLAAVREGPPGARVDDVAVRTLATQPDSDTAMRVAPTADAPMAAPES